MTRTQVSVDNPYVFLLLKAVVGLAGFIGYVYLLASCTDLWFQAGFVVSLAAMILMIFHWARLVERAMFRVEALPSVIIMTLLCLKLLVAASLLSSEAASNPDARFEAFGSTTFVALNTILEVLFFPLLYVACSRRVLQRTILCVYLGTAAVNVYVASSKGALIGIVSNVLFLIFLRRKERGAQSRWSVFGRYSISLLVILASAQIILTSAIYEAPVTETATTAAVRAAMTFDGAIYSCQVPIDRSAPNSFLTYSFLPLLKRINSRYYDIEYYNVPQWLLGEVFNISREGRLVFPNDNLFVTLYFSAPGYVALPVLILTFLFMHLIVTSRIRQWQRSGKANALDIALVLSMTLAYFSTQEFLPMFAAIALLKLWCTSLTAMGHRLNGRLRF